MKFIYIGIALLLFIGNCSTDTKIYTGKEIKLDFNGVRNIPDSAWIKVDGIRYMHYQNFQKQYQDSLSIPASKTKYFVNGKEMFEPNNSYSIAIALGNFIDLNSSRRDERTARIKMDQRYLMSTHGILILHNKKGDEVEVETPLNYPVKIEVLK